MLAAKLFAPKDIRIVECDIPRISEDEILIRTSACALCGTDLRMIENGFKGVDEEHPLTLGHEFSGVVERVGRAVSGYRPGMRVTLAPNIGCGKCDMCVSGNPHLCADFQALGINTDGAFAEYVRIPAQAIAQGNVMILDDSVPMDAAAVFEPMSCVMNGQEQARILLNDVVLIIGAGPIGIMHALLARASGASRVLIRDLSEERMKQCVKIDPSIIPVEGGNLLEEVMKITRNRGVDVCITACPSAKVQEESPELMAVKGRILFFGGLPAGKDVVPIRTNLIHYRQLTICGSTRANIVQHRSVARMVAAGNLDLSALITKKYTLSEFNEAVSYAKSARGLKTVITF
jgi:L-iditol 2-dehydrogenase